ncbi:MAG: presenilin family intramembrane aspartyl protease [Candidatus Woesearchaeota archaeon]|jgi:presenilin-like A22 family membrane protease
MKHTLKVTIFLLLLFLLSHLIGLFLVYITNPVETIVQQDGTAVITHTSVETPGVGKMEPMDHPYIPILIGVLLGTGIALLLIKFKFFRVMKGWHVFGIAICLYISFYNIITFFIGTNISQSVLTISALVIAIILSIARVYKYNVFIHNFTELFIYGGIAVLFAVLFKTTDLKGASIFYASILLIGISIYDAIAVWQSKHMITLAKSQTEQKTFAGLLIPYNKPAESELLRTSDKKIIYGKNIASKTIQKSEQTIPKSEHNNSKSKKSNNNIVYQSVEVETEQKSAILGGGDIAFTLIFSAVVLLSTYSFYKAVIVSLTTTISLAMLFLFAKKDKFYPAMPFLSAGCFIGYGIILLLP